MSNTLRGLSETELLNILALSADAIAVYNTEKIIIEFANDAMLAFWGKDRSVIGKPFEEAIPELNGQEFFEILRNVWRTGITYEATERPARLKVNGQLDTFYFDFVYRAIKNPDGSSHCILHSATDVTQRVLTSKTMRASDERQTFLLTLSDTLRPLADAGLIQIEAARLIGEYLQVSRVGYGEVTDQRWFRTENNWTNGTVPHQHGVHDLEAFGPDVMAAFRKGENLVINDMLIDERTAAPEMQAAFTALQVRSVTTISLLKQGRFVAAFYIHDSNPRYWTKTEIELIEEVAERTWAAVQRAHAEDALRQSEERYRTLFNSIDEAFMLIECIYDEQNKPVNYRLLDVNPAFETQTGMLNALGKTILEVLPSIEPIWIERYGNIALTGQPVRFEDFNASTDRWYNVYASPVQNSANQVVVVFADITERKNDEQRKNDFITMASHELKTPLTSAKAYVQMLNAKARKTQDTFTSGALNKIEHQVNRMETLIKGFLDVAQLGSGKIQLNRQKFLLNDLLFDAVEDIKFSTPSHNLELTPCEDILISADKDKIGQVVHNFLSNAVKYSPKGTTIAVTCRHTDGFAQVSVTDEGMGIKPQDLPKLFDRFYRVESKHTETVAGFGIGLYLCAEIIKRHNGQIDVNSELGKGSTFSFKIPLT